MIVLEDDQDYIHERLAMLLPSNYFNKDNMNTGTFYYNDRIYLLYSVTSNGLRMKYCHERSNFIVHLQIDNPQIICFLIVKVCQLMEREIDIEVIGEWLFSLNTL